MSTYVFTRLTIAVLGMLFAVSLMAMPAYAQGGASASVSGEAKTSASVKLSADRLAELKARWQAYVQSNKRETIPNPPRLPSISPSGTSIHVDTATTVEATGSADTGRVSNSRLQDLVHKYRAFLQDKSGSTAKKTVRGLAQADASCVQTALAEREETLQDAFSVFSSTMSEALMTRAEDLYDAWGIENTEERARAIAAAWKEWRSERKAATRDLRSKRDDAWETFTETVREECKATIPEDERNVTNEREDGFVSL